MKIKYLKVNGFGKLENKEMMLGDRINIVKGNNESGKSTLLNFIAASFFGINKLKNGKEISNYDRFIPWNTDNFSGKIIYRIGEGEDEDEFEIYRDFKKKSPSIYKDGKDVTSYFNIDKAKGNEFFTEQTGITEDMFFKTYLSEQENVKLSKADQNSIIQRLSNLVFSGNENISFKKTIDKINKKQLEEVGTDRSQGRPINIVDAKIEQVQKKMEEIKEYKDRKYEIEEEKNNLNIDIEENKNLLNLLRKVKVLKEKNTIKNEKINILDNEIDGYSNMQKEKSIEIEKLQGTKIQKSKSFNLLYVLLILAMILILVAGLFTNKYLIFLGEIPVILLFVLIFLKSKKSKKERRTNTKKLKEKISELEEDIERLEQIKNLKFDETQKLADELEKEEKKEKEEICEEFKDLIDINTIENILSTKYEKIVEMINEKEAKMSEYKVSEEKIDLSNEEIMKNLENLVCLEEKLDNLYEEKEELNKKTEVFNLVKEILEEANDDMKQNITPEIILEIQNILSSVTEGKYNKAVVDEDGIKIVKEDGDYVDVNRLSIGTIDLIFLALRLSASKSISDEKIPIILDEAFAYYDKERMRNILKYLYNNYDNQIILFTCTSREMEVFDEEIIPYNLISL